MLIMNRSNNQRYQQTEMKFEDALLELLADKDISRITIKEIWALAGVNRSAFYLHHEDIRGLLASMEQRAAEEMQDIFLSRLEDLDAMNECILDLFRYVAQHRAFYKAAMEGNISFSALNIARHPLIAETIRRHSAELGFQGPGELKYHSTFFVGGLSAIVRAWISGGCSESAEYMAAVIYEEYHSQNPQGEGTR